MDFECFTKFYQILSVLLNFTTGGIMQFNKPHPPLRKVEGVALHSDVLKQVMVVLYPGGLNLKSLRDNLLQESAH